MNDTSINLQTRSTTLVNTVMGQGFEEQFFLSNGDFENWFFLKRLSKLECIVVINNGQIYIPNTRNMWRKIMASNIFHFMT